MAGVRVENVTKVYPGGVEAVRDVSFDVADREFLVMVGPSGCGKSTMLRMIAGLETITKGTIRIGDRIVNDVPPKDRDIAMVFQNYALYPHMTVFDNMAFGLKLRKYPKSQIVERVGEAARILALDELLKRRPKELSGGQRQRVAVGRAIVRHPVCFLFDEPLSNLDAKLRVDMRAELKKLHHRLQTTMIYVTHDQTEAMTLASRIVVMKDGVVQQVDPPITVFNKPANLFVAGFIGAPPMNMIPGRVEGVDGKLMFRSGQIRLGLPEGLRSCAEPYAGKDVVLGVRPEDMRHRAAVASAPADAALSATVDVIEPLGSNMLVYVKADGRDLICDMDAQQGLCVGDSVPLVVRQEKMHLFDPQSEQNIALRSA